MPSTGSPPGAYAAPSNVPTAHAGRSSTFRVMVAVSFAVPLLSANVTVYESAFAVATPAMTPLAASHLSPAGRPETFTAQPSASVQSTSSGLNATPE